MNDFKYINVLFLTIFILFSIVSTSAQSNVWFGLKGGWMHSSLVGSDSESQKVKSGFNSGAVFNVSSPSHVLSLQTEFLYTNKKTELTYLSFREAYELQYLEIPILFKLSYPMETFRPNVFAGPYASLKLSEKYTYTELVTEISVVDKNQLKGVDYGAVFGAGVDIDLEPVTFVLDLRYNLGLMDLERDVTPQQELRNGSLSLNAGILFKFN